MTDVWFIRMMQNQGPAVSVGYHTIWLFHNGKTFKSLLITLPEMAIDIFSHINPRTGLRICPIFITFEACKFPHGICLFFKMSQSRKLIMKPTGNTSTKGKSGTETKVKETFPTKVRCWISNITQQIHNIMYQFDTNHSLDYQWKSMIFPTYEING